MVSSTLNKMLVNEFPYLREKYLDEVSWQDGDDTGSHVVYGDVLRPHLKDCILRDHMQEFQIIVNFLEELLALDDQYVNEVVSFSVLEGLEYLFKEKAHLTSLLGDKCKKALIEISGCTSY